MRRIQLIWRNHHRHHHHHHHQEEEMDREDIYEVKLTELSDQFNRESEEKKELRA